MFGSGRRQIPGAAHTRSEAQGPHDMKQVLQYCREPARPSVTAVHENFVDRQSRKAQFNENMFEVMGGGKNAASGAAMFGALRNVDTAAHQKVPITMCSNATNEAALARQQNLTRAQQRTCPFGTADDPASVAPTLQPRLGGVPDAPSAGARNAAFAEANSVAKLLKGRGVGMETPFDEHGGVATKPVGEGPKLKRGSLVPDPPSQQPASDARAEALANKARQQKRSQDENPLIGDYRDPRDTVGKGKGAGHRERLMPEAQMQLMRQGVKNLSEEQAQHANTKVLAESNRQRNVGSLIRFGD